MISVSLLYIYIVATALIIGKVVCHKGDSFFEVVSYGFVIHLALVQVITIPCLLIKTSFNFFLGVYLVFMFGLFVIYLISNKTTFSVPDFRRITPWLIFTFVIVIFQICYSTYMMHTDADDGHMTTVSTVAIKENRLDISFYDVYDGIYTGRMRESIYSWEFFIAILSKLFGIHPAIVDHSVIIAPLLVFSYIAVFCVVRQVFKDTGKQHCSLFFYSLIILYAAYSTHTRGCFMLLRIWQGKAVLTSFLLPMLLHSCIKIYKGDYSWRRWLLNLGIITAGTGCSVIGIYMLPITYIVYGIPLFVILLYRKNIMKFFRLLRRLIITMIPIIIMAGFVLYGAISGRWGGEVIPTGQTEPDWVYSFETTFSGSYMAYLLVAAVFIIVFDYIRKSKKQNLYVEDKLRLLLVVFGLVLFLTFLNPLFCDFVSEHITGIIVYWRLYWVLPMELIISVAVTLLIESEVVRKLKYVITVIFVCSIMFSGRYMYSKDMYFESHQNYYKIPNEVIFASDYLLSKDENPVCVFPEWLSYYPRQYDSHIIIIGARGLPVNQKRIGESDMTYAWLYHSIYADKNLNDETVRWALDEIGIEHIYMQGAKIDSPYYDIAAIEDYGFVYSLKK